jgi:hypothetical protein
MDLDNETGDADFKTVAERILIDKNIILKKIDDAK